jgi:site-specific DNA-methyltransferase (adenine-specific)
LAIRLVKDRLVAPYHANSAKAKELNSTIEIHGLPKDIGSAKELAQNTKGGRLAFQDWIIEVMLGGVSNVKKTADGGFDGYATFNMTEKEKELVLIEVKSGNVNVKNIREFIQVVKTQKAAIGVFVCFEEQITGPMQLEAKHQGYFDHEGKWKNTFPRIQILSVEDILNGGRILMPGSTMGVFKKAKLRSKEGKQDELF